MKKAIKRKEFVLPKAKSLRNCSLSNIVITANNRQLESQLHSLQSNSHKLCVIYVVSV